VASKIKNAPMLVRIIFGLVLGAASLSLLWLEKSFEPTALPLASVAFLVVLAAFHEMRLLLKTRGVDVLWLSGALGAAALATCPFWWPHLAEYLSIDPQIQGVQLLLLCALVMMAIFLEQMFQQAPEMAMLRIAGTVLAVLYLGVGVAMVLMIRLSYGLPFVVLALGSAKFTDIGAYFTGSLIGKHKLIPKLSPKKTWEGLIGGLVLASLICMATVAFFRWIDPDSFVFKITYLQAAIFGPIVGLAGQFGDLSESLLKRSAHVKDSGAILPEFGGVLDIIDSILFSAPVAMILLLMME
jgi:phosphatidate cytidylyltransferase